jgi:LysM repeat protein
MNRAAPPGPRRSLLTGLGALLALLLGTVGVPLLLTRLQLGPTGLPAWHDLATTLTTRDDGHLAAAVLAGAAWACWALFTLTVLHELAGSIRHRPVPLVPGLGWCQRPAAALVAAIAVGISAAPLAVGSAGAAHATAPTRPTTASAPAMASTDTSPGPAPRTEENRGSQADIREAEPAKTYQVRRRDTLWGIAERHLADPLRYPEIIRLNPATVGPDGAIRVGAVLTMPEDATGLTPTATTAGDLSSHGDLEQVQVRPGDTLWDLAEQVSGHGTDWPTAWRINKGRAEPDGQRFTDPDLIRPGWTLDIPTGRGAATHSTETAPQAPVPPAEASARHGAQPPNPTPSTASTAAPNGAAAPTNGTAPPTNGAVHLAPSGTPHNVPDIPTEASAPLRDAAAPRPSIEPRADPSAELPMRSPAGECCLPA